MAPSSARLTEFVMRRVLATRYLALAAVALTLVAAPAMAQIPSVDSLRRVLTRTTYVFEGVVQAWNAVADPSLTPTPNTAKVHVSRVFSCPVLPLGARR